MEDEGGKLAQQEVDSAKREMREQESKEKQHFNLLNILLTTTSISASVDKTDCNNSATLLSGCFYVDVYSVFYLFFNNT